TFTGREVALRTIEHEVFRDPEFGTVYRSQFLQEASLAGKLRHPHIVAILDAVVAEDSGHIAMEYLTGGDLSKHAAPENLLPVADVLQIGFKCCGALEYAAQQGIVHRDIKPANIMLVADTDIKIADFGAASLKRTQLVTTTRMGTTRMGSPYYMSPEQLQSKPVTFHSDKYVALKTVTMLATLSDYEVWELVRAGRWSRVDKGKVVVRENEPGTSFFFLAKGQAKVTLQGRLLNMLNDRECFGEMAYISGGAERRHATVESMTPLLLAEFAPAALE